MKDPCKNPCNDCPWRRDSMPGFLGGAAVPHFEAAWAMQRIVPCHKTVKNPSSWSPDWRWCAGYLIARRNVNDTLLAPAAQRACETVEPSDAVVAGIEGFADHHSHPDGPLIRREIKVHSEPFNHLRTEHAVGLGVAGASIVAFIVSLLN